MVIVCVCMCVCVCVCVCEFVCVCVCLHVVCPSVACTLLLSVSPLKAILPCFSWNASTHQCYWLEVWKISPSFISTTDLWATGTLSYCHAPIRDRDSRCNLNFSQAVCLYLSSPIYSKPVFHCFCQQAATVVRHRVWMQCSYGQKMDTTLHVAKLRISICLLYLANTSLASMYSVLLVDCRLEARHFTQDCLQP